MWTLPAGVRPRASGDESERRRERAERGMGGEADGEQRTTPHCGHEGEEELTT